MVVGVARGSSAAAGVEAVADATSVHSPAENSQPAKNIQPCGSKGPSRPWIRCTMEMLNHCDVLCFVFFCFVLKTD